METPLNPTFDVIARMPKGLENHHLTFVVQERQRVQKNTFAMDNAAHLPDWWILQCAKLLGRKDYRITLICREFLQDTDPATGHPMKRLSICWFEGETINPLTAEQARWAQCTDPTNLKPLPPPPATIFADFVI